MAAIRNFLTATFLGTRRNDYKVPENSIRMVDSRAWDPEWYYRDRHRFLTIALRQLWGPGKGDTMASGESYWWGRRGAGGEYFRPSVHVRKVFKDLWVTNEEVFEHILYLTGMSWRLVRFLRSPRFGGWLTGNVTLEAEMGFEEARSYWSRNVPGVYGSAANLPSSAAGRAAIQRAALMSQIRGSA